MANASFDLVVIGSGPGGYVAAVRAGQLGKTVACVERAELGGICLNWGCIPTKALISDAHLISEMNHIAPGYGIEINQAKFQWQKIVDRSRAVAAKMSKGIEFLFKTNKVTKFQGAAFVSKADKSGVTVEVKDEKGAVKDTLTAKNVLVVTGARNKELPGMKPDGKNIITSKEAMILTEVPKKLIVIGAGAIGVEFAYVYNAFGSEITLIEMLPAILPVEDEEVSRRLETVFKKRGVDVRTKTRTDKIEVKEGGGVKVTVTSLDDNKQSVIEGDKVLVAVGVTGNTENLFAAGCTPLIEKGAIKVDKKFATNVPGVWAAGDVIGPPWLAHVASMEATIAVERMFGVNEREMDYTVIPGCTYCYPQVASVGMTEKAVKAAGMAYDVGKYFFTASGKAQAINDPEGFVKLIFSKEHGELLGAHILGADATEMIAELVLAKRLEATKEEISSTIHAHPTLSEAVMDAAGAVGE